MGGAGEVFAGHFREDSGAGPDADAGHRGQDLVKRVGLHEGFDLGGDTTTLMVQGQQLFGQFRQNDPCSAGAHDHNAVCSPRAAKIASVRRSAAGVRVSSAVL